MMRTDKTPLPERLEPIQLPLGTRDRLEKYSLSSGVPKAHLVRLAILQKLDQLGA